MARAVQAVAAAWGGLQDAEAQAAAGPPPGAPARFRCHHPRDARLHWRTAVSRPASLGLSIAWASGLPLGLPASRQCALRQAPPASGQARGGLQPRPASADTQIWAPPGRYSIAPTSLVFRTGARCLHSLQSVMAPSRGQPNTSSPLPRNWLLPSMLERGVTPAPGDARLGCFVRACAARPVVVAAFGGSVTSGLAYKVLSAKDQGGQDFAHLYHRQLASWMGRRWPATQSRALELNQSINLGVPGTGPALTALCLTSMQPRPPDLALVEFGINANARDLPHFTSLLRTLRDARVPLILTLTLTLTVTLARTLTLTLALILTRTLALTRSPPSWSTWSVTAAGAAATARTAAPRPTSRGTRRAAMRRGHPRCARSRPSLARRARPWSTCAAPSAPRSARRPTRSAAS